MRPGLHKFGYVVCLVLAAICIRACWRIERLNTEAGGILPRKDFTDSGNNKWRTSLLVTEERWVERHRKQPDGTVDRTPLTAAEKIKVELDIKRAKAGNELREVVKTTGLYQYGFCLLLIAGSTFLLFGKQAKWRRTSAVCLLLSGLVCLGFAVGRGYYSSVGW